MFPHTCRRSSSVFFYYQLEKITDDKWVLQTLKEGLKLEFLKFPNSNRCTQNKCQFSYIRRGSKMIRKVCNRTCTLHGNSKRFLQYILSGDKKNRDLRPIINLRPLNRYMVKKHFKMDTLIKFLNLVNKNDWAISLYLNDAFLHISMHPNHRKYLRFHVQGKAYQFKAMCFSPTQTPRVFTKIIATVPAYLRVQHIRLVAYIDDWLIVNSSKKKHLLLDREKVLKLPLHLGFIINKTKSQLISSQKIVYLGVYSD